MKCHWSPFIFSLLAPWSIVFELLSTVLTFGLLWINLVFLYTPIFDALRRRQLAIDLTNLISVSSVRAERGEILPFIDLFKAQNVYAWLYTRFVIQSYGKRMLARLDAYISAYLVICLILIAVISIIVLSGKISDSLYGILFFMFRNEFLFCISFCTLLSIFNFIN